jgi:hypothetical protein
VIVIQNAKSPAVVRPMAGDEQGLTLIGPAYVNGIMYGEALDRIDSGEAQWQAVYIQ